MVTAPLLLCLAGRRPPHQRPFLLVAAGAEALVASKAPDGVQVVTGVLGRSWGRPRRYGSQRRRRGADGGGGERRTEGEEEAEMCVLCSSSSDCQFKPFVDESYNIDMAY